ncbi:Imm1 family immunity protein [Nocardia sp. NRRL S-836]|uniref:Imm1 family immunity protein n=1 Tax=Nocardia sp. NRRL S-836 TaxID=1519492 RepID=UPI0006AE770C|nr:Imm1 family immunity protein [Nocardia sp. NRRL S-836]KOV83459.1 hypothetical protein ADL03_20495 [Nocardia sp. NRRL S-836]
MNAVDMYYSTVSNPCGRTPVTVQTESEMLRALHEILTNRQPQPTVMYAKDRPTIGRRNRPDHQIKFDVDAESGIGALHAAGMPNFIPPRARHGKREDAEEQASDEMRDWASKADIIAVDDDGTLMVCEVKRPLYIDFDTRTEFPADAVLPLDKVREALLEFMATEQRPTCVAWQDSEIIV